MLGIVWTIAGVEGWIGVSLWRGASWARLIVQILTAVMGLSLILVTANETLTGKPDSFVPALVAIPAFLVCYYLERPAVRASFGLQTVGLIGQFFGRHE